MYYSAANRPTTRAKAVLIEATKVLPYLKSVNHAALFLQMMLQEEQVDNDGYVLPESERELCKREVTLCESYSLPN